MNTAALLLLMVAGLAGPVMAIPDRSSGVELGDYYQKALVALAAAAGPDKAVANAANVGLGMLGGVR